MIRTVPIKFRTAGKHYIFNAQEFELTPGDQVVVETDRGRALGLVVSSPVERPPEETPEGLKSVLRHATEDDLALAAASASREQDAYRFCLDRIKDRKMEMKLVRAEYLFDGSKIIFYFTADGRVDFRELVKDLAHHFHTRIEMRQIGVRDEAKLIGGLGICGRELCCCTFLTDFAPVSVRMAKEQGLALNPNKISGQCGRLLCCLGYEFDTYCQLKKGLPKCGRKIDMGNGVQAEVVEQSLLTQKVKLRYPDGRIEEVAAEEVRQKEAIAPSKPEEKSAPPQKADSRRPSGRSKGGKPQGAQKKSHRPEKKTEKGEAPKEPKDSAQPPKTDEQRPAAKRKRSRRRPRRK